MTLWLSYYLSVVVVIIIIIAFVDDKEILGCQEILRQLSICLARCRYCCYSCNTIVALPREIHQHYYVQDHTAKASNLSLLLFDFINLKVLAAQLD